MPPSAAIRSGRWKTSNASSMRDWTVRDILVRPTGALFIFSGGEEYYAPGLRVGLENPTQCEALAQIAAKARFGSYEDLLRHYRDLPADYIGPLYPLIPEKALRVALFRQPLFWSWTFLTLGRSGYQSGLSGVIRLVTLLHRWLRLSKSLASRRLGVVHETALTVIGFPITHYMRYD